MDGGREVEKALNSKSHTDLKKPNKNLKPTIFNILYLDSLQIVQFLSKDQEKKNGIGWVFYEHGYKRIFITKSCWISLLNTTFLKAYITKCSRVIRSFYMHDLCFSFLGIWPFLTQAYKVTRHCWLSNVLWQ